MVFSPCRTCLLPVPRYSGRGGEYGSDAEDEERVPGATASDTGGGPGSLKALEAALEAEAAALHARTGVSDATDPSREKDKKQKAGGAVLPALPGVQAWLACASALHDALVFPPPMPPPAKLPSSNKAPDSAAASESSAGG